MTPELKHVCDIDVEVGPIRDLGPTPHGRRRIIAIRGGQAHGPRLAGEIIKGGADWQYVRSDGVVELGARLVCARYGCLSKANCVEHR